MAPQKLRFDVSFYAVSPSGFYFELGWSSDGDDESESWPPVTDEGINVWTRSDKRRMVKRLRDQQRSSRSVTPHVVEGFGRVAKRRPDSNRKREPTELDEPRHLRKRFGFRSKQDPPIVARSSGQSGAHLPLLLDNAKGAADPTPLIEALHQRMDSGRLAQRALSQAREQPRLIVPCGEVERRVECASQIREWIAFAFDRLGRTRLEAGGKVRRLGDGGDARSPFGEGLQGQRSQAAGG